MDDKQPNVKGFSAGRRKLLDFIDSHPRTGWFLCILMGVNTALNILTLVLL